MIERQLTIINKLGLHARAAAKFVTTASEYNANISVSKEGRTVNGKSIMGVMMLAAAKGTTITVQLEGDDAEAAYHSLEALVNDYFGEGE
jgi:phosphocarrier protein